MATFRYLDHDILQVRPPTPPDDDAVLAAKLTVCDGLLDVDDARVVLEMLGLESSTQAGKTGCGQGRLKVTNEAGQTSALTLPGPRPRSVKET